MTLTKAEALQKELNLAAIHSKHIRVPQSTQQIERNLRQIPKKAANMLQIVRISSAQLQTLRNNPNKLDLLYLNQIPDLCKPGKNGQVDFTAFTQSSAPHVRFLDERTGLHIGDACISGAIINQRISFLDTPEFIDTLYNQWLDKLDDVSYSMHCHQRPSDVKPFRQVIKELPRSKYRTVLALRHITYAD